MGTSMAGWIGRTLHILIAAVACGGAAPSAARDAATSVAGDAALAVKVNGVPAQLLVNPGEPNQLNCTLAFAARAGLVASGAGSIAQIGPVEVIGSYAETVLKLRGRTTIVPVVWPTTSFRAPTDCAIGPTVFDADTVRFELHPPGPGESSVTLPYLSRGMSAYYTYAQIDMAGVPVGVRFDLYRRKTVATASAALAIASALGGRVVGPIGRTEIAFGVERPIRRMELATPLQVGPLVLRVVNARVADWGDASHIRSNRFDADEAVGDDIVVVARKRKPHGGNRWLRIGADDLAQCSAIVFDQPARTITLTCATAAS